MDSPGEASPFCHVDEGTAASGLQHLALALFSRNRHPLFGVSPLCLIQKQKEQAAEEEEAGGQGAR